MSEEKIFSIGGREAFFKRGDDVFVNTSLMRHLLASAGMMLGDEFAPGALVGVNITNNIELAANGELDIDDEPINTERDVERLLESLFPNES